MRKVLYVALLLSCLLIPVKRLDISKLEPVEAVAVTVKNGMVHLYTDTKSEGEGVTVEEALNALKRNASGIIYLDTARFLLVGEGANREAEQLKEIMRTDVMTAAYKETDVKEEAMRLDAHDLAEKPWG